MGPTEQSNLFYRKANGLFVRLLFIVLFYLHDNKLPDAKMAELVCIWGKETL